MQDLRVLVLASASPRRRALLAQAGIAPGHVVAPDIDETPRKHELPRAYALRMAIEKAASVMRDYPGAVVLAADTVVARGRRILPKANTAEEVAACLQLLSGRRHLVLTAVAVQQPGRRMKKRIVSTRVAFKRLTLSEIDGYAAEGQGIGKAGGYGIQGSAEAFVRFINGSYSNVVGLPLYETLAMLTGSGVF